ncbi:Uncharacterised protein [uncultured archaeon]|nr:Uncharacterised protein [uncultured archaeon]
MRDMQILLLALLLMAPVLLADIGPPPPRPQIMVQVTENGTPYMGEIRAVYHCPNAGEEQGTVSPYNVNLTCKQGTCTNSNWYYKFNPCYYSQGFVEVSAAGKTVSTPEMDLKDAGPYQMRVDLASGQSGPVPLQDAIPLWALGILALVVVAGGVLLLSRRKK